MRESNSRSDSKGPGAEDGRLAQEREFAEDLQRSLLQDVIGEGCTRETSNVATQRRIGVAEKLFQRCPVAALRQKDQKGWVGRRGLRRFGSGVHA